MSFSLLIQTEDWIAYKNELARRAGVAVDLVQWGSAPQTYPCLAESIRIAENGSYRFLTCYVYPEDVRRLLAAAPQRQFGPVSESAPAPAGYLPGRDPADAFRFLTAHVLAIAYWLTETRICSQARYEAQFHRMLSLVDQTSAEDREGLLTQVAQRAGAVREPE